MDRQCSGVHMRANPNQYIRLRYLRLQLDCNMPCLVSSRGLERCTAGCCTAGGGGQPS